MDQTRTLLRWVLAACLLAGLALALMPPQGQPTTGWDKANHVVAFAVLALLGCAAYPASKARVLMALLAYGCVVELLQALTSYRTAEWMDVVADAVGLLSGWQLGRLAPRLRRRGGAG